GYAYGDEPWVGDFGASEGDVGWYKEGLVKYEQFISPVKHRYAGYWDHGNEAAGEQHHYTEYADFIEWVTPTPSYVYFSNSFDACCSATSALQTVYNRVINIAWLNQILLPGDSKDHILFIGMATVDPLIAFPKKPETVLE
ncbi:MAG: hypothetical protein Q8J64_04045, partial [Thermodesulfovibrionales bacterium]|nr:hypothetical protein [Thermodesulfovibrionales bacterium]